MIVDEKVKENVFVEQTTFYIYASEEDRQNGKHIFVSSNREEFDKIKEKVKNGDALTSKGFSL